MDNDIVRVVYLTARSLPRKRSNIYASSRQPYWILSLFNDSATRVRSTVWIKIHVKGTLWLRLLLHMRQRMWWCRALFFAVGLFCSLLVLVGPIGDQGSLRAIYERLKGGDGGSVKVAPSSSTKWPNEKKWYSSSITYVVVLCSFVVVIVVLKIV